MSQGEIELKSAILIMPMVLCALASACGGKCKPNCDGKECGYDECGGTCGFCEIGHLCEYGNCICPENAPVDCGVNGCWGYGTDCNTVGSCSLSGYNCYACDEGSVSYCCGDGGGNFFMCCPIGWYPCSSLGCAETPEACNGVCYSASEPGECNY